MSTPQPEYEQDDARVADDAKVLAVADGGPTVLRIALGGQLRRLRESRGISRQAAGDAIRASHAKISRLELGRVGIKERDVTDLLTLYGVTDAEERRPLLDLAQRANTPGWWHRFNDVLPDWFETYIGLEQAASVIRTYESQFVPGLLQTPEYARSVVMLAHGHESESDIERRITVRSRRQEMLFRPDAPSLWAVIDESALRRPYGGPEVMRAQLKHLIDMADLPTITIQVVPYAAGGHAAAGGPFTVLRFPQPDLPDIVYLEQLTSALYLEKQREVDSYLGVMDRLSVQAARPEDTASFLRGLLDEL